MKANSGIRAATYSRFSSANQKETSLEDQRRNTHERARREGWRVVRDFEDAAISGSDNMRPGYREMQAAAATKDFDVLVVDDLSRLTRDSVEQEQVIRRLEFHGIRIVSTTDGYDSTSAARKIHRGFKGLQNEMFLEALAGYVHRGQRGQAEKGRWNGGRPYGYLLKRLLDTSRRDQYGEPLRVGTVLAVDPNSASVVVEIFTRFADGESYGGIAADLNARGVPSAGSTWARKVRRGAGWMDSSVRAIIVNPLYTGQQRWNTSKFVRDPDTKKHKRIARPESDWVVHRDEKLRIVSDELFARAQHRGKALRDGDPRLKCGGKPKYLLSGLLVCGVCGKNYVLAGERSYGCGSYIGGRLCINGERIRRDRIEAEILGPVRNDLLAPSRVARMAKEFEALATRHAAEVAARADRAPKELLDLEARIARLRARLAGGDEDLTSDELEAAIAKAEAKKAALQAAQPTARHTAKIVAMIPKAAAAYREAIEAGLDGDPRAALKARVILRDLLGPVTLEPGRKGELWATYRLAPAALVKSARTDGRGERI